MAHSDGLVDPTAGRPFSDLSARVKSHLEIETVRFSHAKANLSLYFSFGPGTDGRNLLCGSPLEKACQR